MQFQFISFSSIDSTNDEAKRIVKLGKATPSIITSKTQTAGRGRYGRKWETGDKNLYMSILIPIECSLSKASELSFVIGLATYEAINSFSKDIPIKLKWPNDVFINDKKIGGVLIESITHKKETWVVIGLGLNILSTPIETSSCLKNYGIITTAPKMIKLITKHFEKYYNLWDVHGFDTIRTSWLKNAYLIGKEINIGDANKRITGVFESIDNTGAIVLKLPSKETYRMSIGEIFI